MESVKRVVATFGVLVVLIVIFYLITSTITKTTGYFVSEDPNKKNDFEKCLKEKEIVLFINSEIPSETLKELRVSEYLSSFEIFNCLRNKEFCINNRIKSFPVFVIEGKNIDGDISVEVLEELSGCRLKSK